MQSTSCTAVQRNTSNGLKHHKASKTQLCSVHRCWQVSFHATYFLNFESGEVPRARCRCQAQNQTLPSALPTLPDLPGNNCTLTSTHKMHKTATITLFAKYPEFMPHVAPGCCLAASWIWTGRQSAKGLGTWKILQAYTGPNVHSLKVELQKLFGTFGPPRGAFVAFTCFYSLLHAFTSWLYMALYGFIWLWHALTCFDMLWHAWTIWICVYGCLWYWHIGMYWLRSAVLLRPSRCS